MKKRIIIIVSIIIGVFVLGISTGVIFLSVNETGISSGYCLKTDNGTCFLVKGNTPVRLSAEGFAAEKLSEFNTGDKLLVLHDGIAESYPAVTFVRLAVKTGEGSIDDIPDTVTAALNNLGWLDTSKGFNSEEYSFSAEYIKTGCPSDDNISFPSVTVIDSAEKLSKYQEDYAEKYALNENFIKEAEKYTEEFFDKSSLVLIYLCEGSGSITHNVNRVISEDNNALSVYIKTNMPETGTCDMAYHHIFVSLEKRAADNKEIKLFIDGKNMSKKWEAVTLSQNFANFSLSLPEKWKYTENKYESEGNFGISFYHEDAPESSITVEYLTAFGVCGTGLSTSDTNIGGHKAVKGVYDGNPVWDFIHFSDAPGDYVIYNNADSLWWKEYGDEAQEILDTIKIAEGIIFREEALLIAEKNAGGTYKRTYGEFDSKEGIWSFVFVKSETEYHARISAAGELLPDVNNLSAQE